MPIPYKGLCYTSNLLTNILANLQNAHIQKSVYASKAKYYATIDCNTKQDIHTPKKNFKFGNISSTRLTQCTDKMLLS